MEPNVDDRVRLCDLVGCRRVMRQLRVSCVTTAHVQKVHQSCAIRRVISAAQRADLIICRRKNHVSSRWSGESGCLEITVVRIGELSRACGGESDRIKKIVVNGPRGGVGVVLKSYRIRAKEIISKMQVNPGEISQVSLVKANLGPLDDVIRERDQLILLVVVVMRNNV